LGRELQVRLSHFLSSERAEDDWEYRGKLTGLCRRKGRVKLAKHKITGQYAAIKIVPKPRGSKSKEKKAEKVRFSSSWFALF
jgi:hypothetical protein